MIKKFIIIMILFSILRYDIAMCEPLMLSEKLYFFNILLQNSDPEFKKYLMDNFIQVISSIKNFSSVQEISEYINDLRERFNQ